MKASVGLDSFLRGSSASAWQDHWGASVGSLLCQSTLQRGADKYPQGSEVEGYCALRSEMESQGHRPKLMFVFFSPMIQLFEFSWPFLAPPVELAGD